MHPIITKLNRIPGKVMPVVNVNQYDKSESSLVFEVFDGDLPFNISSAGITIMGTKPDRTGFSYAASATGYNEVIADLEQQMTAVAGDVMCELRFTEMNMIQGTLNFILRVEPAALADDTVISETQIPMIEQAAEIAAQVVAYVEDARASANASATSADEAEQANQSVQSTVANITTIVTENVETRLTQIAINAAAQSKTEAINTSVAQSKAYTDEKLDRSHEQFLKVFTVLNGWTLQSGGSWNDYYANTISITNIYNKSAHVRASGLTISDPPSDEVRGAVSGMYFELDDTEMKLTAYTKKAPDFDIYVCVEGVQ